MATKFIFVTGGVTSSLGKGLLAASLARLLRCRGLKVSIMKLDPYLNTDPGTMNPYQHGEVYVTDDGAETDLDLGHYERFADVPLTRAHSVTTGRIYQALFEHERKGEFLGQTIQVLPHVTDEIKNSVLDASRKSQADVQLVEIGGTIGDIESVPYQEAIRQFQWDVGRENCLYIHLTLLPYLPMSDELKTKPTQHSVRQLMSMGIQPEILVCRSSFPIPDDQRRKISLFCNVPVDHVVDSLDASTIYEVPLLLAEQNLDGLVCQHFGLQTPPPDLAAWREIVAHIKNPKRTVTIALVGKYVELHDAYLSIKESLTHASAYHQAKLEIQWIQSENITPENVAETLKDADGILVPGGFGNRGLEGKILAIQYAREKGVPFLGICLGMQMAVIEFARNVLGLTGAHSSEADPETPYPVIDLMPEQADVTQLGGTMRLGGYDCHLIAGTKARAAYGQDDIRERHRHRYEFNNDYRDQFEAGGMRISGVNPGRNLVEIVELPAHPWFVAAQFHPEFLSRPNRPHPLFRDFVGASLNREDR
ncbi:MULTISPECIES: CTP synthase [unclassified Clostridium]|jgi:CTP synthase|uniref:CTP synthase n=1 Tax=Clostridia TaxID=186801 RepID=UPI00110638D7|nr:MULTISPECIES: CTP synthase [unclassified Clostridium]